MNFRKRKIVISILICISFLVLTLTEEKTSSDLDIEEFSNSQIQCDSLTISDLVWYSGSYDMYDYDWSKSFNPVKTGVFGFDKNSTTLHCYEITGAHRYYVGWYTSFSTEGDFFSLSFLQKMRANHQDAVRTFILVFDTDSNKTIHKIDTKGNGFGVYENTTLETEFLSYEYTLSTKGSNEVTLFLGFYDSWSTDWQQETWIKDLRIKTNADPSSASNAYFEKQISSILAEPQELLWLEDKLLCVGINLEDNAKCVAEIDPKNGNYLNYYTLNEIDVNFPACALAFDGTHFYTIKNNGYATQLTLQKYSSDFTFINSSELSLSTPANAIGYGLTFDGEYLWMSDPYADLIYQIDKSSADIIRSIPAPGASPRGLEYDNGFLWVVESSENQIHKLNSSDGTILESYPTYCEYPWGITIDDSKTIWISSRASPFIYNTKLQTEETSHILLITILPLVMFVVWRKKRS